MESFNAFYHGRFTRRAMLRGLGVTMALPWLESLSAFADDSPTGNSAQPPVRLAVLFAGNGFHSREWWMKGAGREIELGKVLEPLSPLKEKLLLVRGLYNAEAGKGGIHGAQTGNLLTGTPWKEAAAFARASAWIRPSPSAWAD